MEVDIKDLLNALSKRIIAANGEVLQKAHTLSQAEVGRDALAKVLKYFYNNKLLFFLFYENMLPIYLFVMLFRRYMIGCSLGL